MTTLLMTYFCNRNIIKQIDNLTGICQTFTLNYRKANISVLRNLAFGVTRDLFSG